MGEKVKNFIKANLGCIGWSFTYVMLQIIVTVALFIGYFKFSDTFKLDFLNIFGWLQTSQTMSDIEFTMNMMQSLMSLTDTIVLPIIGISGVLICGIVAINSIKTKKQIIKKISKEDFAKYVLIGCSLNYVVTLILYFLPESIMDSYSLSVGLATTGNFAIVLLVAGIIGPITEEVLFRYFEFNSCKRIGIRYAIIVTAVSFGMMHGNLIQGTYCFIFGLIFAYYDYKEKNLLPSIIIHMTINLASVLISFNWSDEIAGLLAYFSLAFAMYFLISRKEEGTAELVSLEV